MTIQLQDRIRVKLKPGQCAACYGSFPCACTDAFFADPEAMTEPEIQALAGRCAATPISKEMPTKDYPLANVLSTNWSAVLISFVSCLGLILIALGGLYVVYRMKMAGWMQ
jgi:hypothetical protein